MSRRADLMGHSLMFNFKGTPATPEFLHALGRTRACSVILFAHDIDTPDQLHQLNHMLQAMVDVLADRTTAQDAVSVGLLTASISQR